MSSLEDALKDPEITKDITQEFASQYITAVIDNIRGRFPLAHTLTLLGYLDPWNVSKSPPPTMNELGDLMGEMEKSCGRSFCHTHFLLRICQSYLQQLCRQSLILVIRKC